MSEWQPINTAPGVGYFLAYYPGSDELGWEPCIIQSFKDADGYVISIDSSQADDGIDPTHWMPLPNPPVSNSQERETEGPPGIG